MLLAIGNLDGRLGAISAAVDRLSERLAIVERRIELLEEAVSRLDRRMALVEGALAEIKERLSRLSRDVLLGATSEAERYLLLQRRLTMLESMELP